MVDFEDLDDFVVVVDCESRELREAMDELRETLPDVTTGVPYLLERPIVQLVEAGAVLRVT